MDLLLQRRPSDEHRTHGDIYDDLGWIAFSLEDPVRIDDPSTLEDEGAKIPKRTAIPAGRYRLTLEHSPHFGPDTITLTDQRWKTPGHVGMTPDQKPLFTGIRAHGANDEDDVEGCVGVGKRRNLYATIRPFIWNAQPALNELKRKIQEATEKGEEAWLEVSNDPYVSSTGKAKS